MTFYWEAKMITIRSLEDVFRHHQAYSYLVKKGKKMSVKKRPKVLEIYEDDKLFEKLVYRFDK
jgi:hypothetical protein